MSTLQRMFEHYKFENEITTDIALANSLGVSRTALVNYRNGDRRLPDIAISKLAQGLGIDVEEVLAAVNLNLKNTSQHELQFWMEKILDHGSRYVTAGLMVVVTLFLTPSPAEAAPVLKQTSATIYIMSNTNARTDF